jgi:hypothetical protein
VSPSRIFPVVIAVSVLLFAAVIGKFAWRSAGEVRLAAEALGRNDVEDATSHYFRAFTWYFPGNPYIERAIRGLWETGERMEAEGRKKPAMKAYEDLRSGIYSVRSYTTPYGEWIERCDDKIAGFFAAEIRYAKDEKMTYAQRKEYYLKTLGAPERPSKGWAAVAVFGFFGWIGSMLTFLLSGGAEPEKTGKTKAMILATIFILSYAAWLIGMKFA